MLTTVSEHTFDYWDLVQLRACRAELVRKQRRLQVEELAVTRGVGGAGRARASDKCHRGARC